ncbi:hypothetical protein DRO54_03855 [Candidatus Bathyarchaeota archaeon]|nr:MAG: hypothetical protein DRO54_03855 [Candidatus Bathyarchaeota archaeon]
MVPNNSIAKQLKDWFSDAKKVVIAGIGNEIRRDDFVGVKIVRELAKKLESEDILLIECETVPESYVGQIAKFNPSHVLLIDAGMLGLDPGQAKLVDVKQLAMYPAISTHALPLRIFCELVEEMTKAKIALLAIQPKNVDFGEGLSPELEKTANQITRILLGILAGK